MAVVFDPEACSPLQLNEHIGSRFDLVWVVDRSLPDPDAKLRVLPRLGAVVDVTGVDGPGARDLLGVESPRGIVCFSDRCLGPTAALAAGLGLPALSTECVTRLVDKVQQRRAFQAAGVEVPRYWQVQAGDHDGIERVCAEARFPVVVKPEVGEGSRDTEPAADAEAARRLLTAAGSVGRDTIVEEMLVGDPTLPPDLGDYVSVESVVSDGRISHAMVTGRFPLAEPFRETGFFMPAVLDPFVRRQVLELATSAIEAVGFTVGCTHTEIKLTPDGPRVIEVNGRLGGGMADLLALVSDVDLFQMAARVAAGEPATLPDPVAVDGMSYLFYVQAPMSAEQVVGLDGIDDLVRWPGVVEVTVNRRVGSVVDWRDGNHGNVFSLLGRTAGPTELLELARDIERKVTISYD